MKLRLPDFIEIQTFGGVFSAPANQAAEIGGVQIRFAPIDARLRVEITAEVPLSFIKLNWRLADSEKREQGIKIMADAWERAYGDLCWREIDADRTMPWYFAVSNGSDSSADFSNRLTECFGVAVQPNSLCSWKYDGEIIQLTMDIRNGGRPVKLAGRTLKAAEIIFEDYRRCSAFSALCGFCKKLSPSPLKYDGVIFGSNNWYYAYGKSSREEILTDARLIAEIAGSGSKPFMVIDDGWQINMTNPPWEPNERFGSMETLAREIENTGAIPGIWVRYLADQKLALTDLPDEARLERNKKYLDPSHPAVKVHIKNLTETVIGWGYRLIKHDFSTFDITGKWGFEMPEVMVDDGYGFFDESKTTAEIILDFYRLILECAGDAAILGCNCVSHLCAGLVHANRTGDDTSGTDWSRTLKMGVNALAFRAAQNEAFYIADADCVGITGKIDWGMNSQWLKLLAQSGSALFTSCKPDQAAGIIKENLIRAFEYGSKQADSMIPLDWMETPLPCEYLINGEKHSFTWTK